MKKSLKDTEKKKERRRFFRVNLVRRVRYSVLGFTSIDCFTQDIGEGGMCLLLGEKLHPGMMIKAEFALPGKEPELVQVHAVVVWQKNYLTGVKFVI